MVKTHTHIWETATAKLPRSVDEMWVAKGENEGLGTGDRKVCRRETILSAKTTESYDNNYFYSDLRRTPTFMDR